MDQRKTRILLLETVDLTRKLAIKTLSEAGYEVECVNDDNDLLDVLTQRAFAAVIIGKNSSNASIAALCQAIRRLVPDWKLPVIVTSDTSLLNEVKYLMDSGASDFIEKPIKWPVLLSRLDLALRLTTFSNELSRKESRLRKAQTMARIGYWHMKDDPSNVTFSEQFCNILDIPPGSIKTYQDIFDIVHPDDQEQFMAEVQMAFIKQKSFSFSHRIKMDNGQEFYVSQMGEFYFSDDDKNSKELFITMRDETEINFAKEKLHQEKYYDAVTSLPNRALLMEKLKLAIAEAEANERMLSCILIGLNGFNAAYDVLGPSGSDKLLKVVGDRLRIKCVNCIAVARVGTDTFVLISDRLNTVEQAEARAQELIELVACPIEIENHVFNIKSNAGLSFFPIDSDTPDGLLAAADTAMHDAKNIGIEAVALHTQKMHKNIRKKLAIESELKAAIENGDLELFYQPQVSVIDQHISGMEALIRWNHKERGLIPPFEFIEIAEERGLIVPMGDWIMQTACKEATKFHQLGFPDLRVGINISAKQFNDKGFLRMVEKAVTESKINPSTLELEVTESSAMSNVDSAIKILHSLRELGAHTSMDDFGTGFSSLSSLQLLPLNTLKIDRAFVKNIGEKDNSTAIASAILAMAKGLKMETVAEGVETEAQLDFMKQNRCDFIQGYYYSKPLSKGDFEKYLFSFDRANLCEVPESK